MALINSENIKLFPIEESDSECYQLWYGWIMYNNNPYMNVFSHFYQQGIYGK